MSGWEKAKRGKRKTESFCANFNRIGNENFPPFVTTSSLMMVGICFMACITFLCPHDRQKIRQANITTISAFVKLLNCGIFVSFSWNFFWRFVWHHSGMLASSRNYFCLMSFSSDQKKWMRREKIPYSSICKACVCSICMYVIPLVEILSRQKKKSIENIFRFYSNKHSKA